MPPHRRTLAPHQALLLGLAQGPTELLPVSSSGHTVVIAFLAGWPYEQLDPALRKSFEVSLHTGAALALATAAPELRDASLGLDRRALASLALSSAPSALAGYLLEDRIEQQLGSPRQVACALAAGAVAMALADARAGTRALRDARPHDALAVGLAQAIALVPGVSRSGAALTAARALRFARPDAHTLSSRAAGPLMAGASALTAARAITRGLPAGSAAMLAAGAAGAFCSTLACARALGRRDRALGPLLPYALYRLALAALVAQRLRGHSTPRRRPSPQ